MPRAPLRILHVTAVLEGGVGVAVMNWLRHMDRGRFHCDILTHSIAGPEQEARHDQELAALGVRRLRCVELARRRSGIRFDHFFVKHFRLFSRLLRQNGPYDIVHCHAPFAGYLLALTRRLGVPVRIAHSHTSAAGYREDDYGGVFGLWQQATNTLFRGAATHGLAVSRAAAVGLFGPNWKAGGRVRILPCGIDFSPLLTPSDPADIRRDLGIPASAVVVGHVGRMSREKNHRFLVEVFAELARRDPQYHLLLVGDGVLREAITERVQAIGLANRVTLTGYRPDAVRLLPGMDVFTLPSLHEGLSLTLIEAQAAGIPCVASSAVPEEAVTAVPGLVTRLPLDRMPAAWADAIGVAARLTPDRQACLRTLTRSAHDITTNVRWLEDYYTACVAGLPARGASP